MGWHTSHGRGQPNGSRRYAFAANLRSCASSGCSAISPLTVCRGGASVLQVADRLMAKVHAEFTYAPGETEIATPLLEVFHRRRGVCQDYAHCMIACLRSAGLAARYVSGYLRTHGESLVGADASHAWVAVFAPPFGWVEFDPTNNVRVRQEHVALAWGRDFGDVSPLRGVILGGGSHTLSVSVAMEPLPEPALERPSG